MIRIYLKIIFIAVAVTSLGWSSATYRYSAATEDTVRVLIIYNNIASGHWYCPEATKWPGLKGKDFVLEAIDGIPNIKIMKSSEATWAGVQAAWAPVLPHVIVHVNGGWYSVDGPNVPGILVNAANNAVGIVDVGDDAGAIGKDVFGFQNVINSPGWLSEGVDHGDWRTYEPVWIVVDSTQDAPQGHGIIRNGRKLMASDTLFWKTFGVENGRCHADADQYEVGPGYWEMLSFMAWQYANTGSFIAGMPKLYASIGAFGNGTRRGAALSFQPNELVDKDATEQIVYDAIMWASFARQGFKRLDPPVADPAGKDFELSEQVRISSSTDGAGIYYRLNGGTFELYPGNPLTITETTVLQAFAAKEGLDNSDTISENYIKTAYTSGLEFSRVTGEVLDSSTYLTEKDTKVIVKLTAPYAGLTSVSIQLTTSNSLDTESVTINNYIIQNNRHIFYDTLDFSISAAVPGNASLEASAYDFLTARWSNPLNASDKPSALAEVKPGPREAKVYFSTTDALTGETAAFAENKTPVWVIVDDQMPQADSLAAGKYRVTITTRSADITELAKETETLTLSLINGFLAAQIPAVYGVLKAEDKILQVLLNGDHLTASYSDPMDTTDVNRQASASYAKKTVQPPSLPSWSDGTGNNFFLNDTLIAITNNSAGATIRYTISDAAPTVSAGTVYNGNPVSLNTTSTLRAVAYFSNGDHNSTISPVVTQTYNLRGQIGLPTASPAGSYFTGSVMVTLTPAQADDSIYYTLDGSSLVSGSARKLYTNQPLAITGTAILKFYACNGSGTPSPVGQEAYTKRLPLDAPVASPPGSDFFGSIQVGLSNPVATDALIRYTLDGSDPVAASPVYSSAIPFNFTSPVTLKAKAFPPGDAYIPSTIITENYRPIAAVPAANPDSGTSFVSVLSSVLTTSTYDADIYYTLDGTTPDTSSSKYTGLLRFFASDTLKAVAARPGWKNSDVLTVIYTKQYTPSTLRILDANYLDPEYLTEKNSSYIISIKTAEPLLSVLQPVAVTTTGGDMEILPLTPYRQEGELYFFSVQVPFMADGNSLAGDDTSQSAAWDSLVVSWVNPNNTRDAVADTVLVRPYPVQASLYFSESLVPGNPIRQYATETDYVYLVVKDQKAAPGAVNTATLISSPPNNDREPDTLTVTLQETQPGIFSAAVPVDKSFSGNAGDALLQVRRGDGITAIYTDPVDGDAAQGTVLYGTVGETEAEVMFTDKTGDMLSDSTFWSPDKDSLYITYIDDYSVLSKELLLTAENTSGTGAKTFDTLRVTFPPAVRNDSLGIWRVAVPMSETVFPGDSTVLEVFFFGRVTALITSHTKEGLAGSMVKDELNVAYADETAKITLKDKPENSTTIARTTTDVEILLNDQNFSTGKDTVFAVVTCLGTGDNLYGVQLIEDKGGEYRMTIQKDESGADNSDSILNCEAEDDIKVSYLDPVYNTGKSYQTYWRNSKETKIYFTAPGEEYPVTSLNQIEETTFNVVAEAVSPRKNVKDTLTIILEMENGETQLVSAVETSVFSGIYQSGVITYGFSLSPSENNSVLEGMLDPASTENTSDITASLSAVYDTAQAVLHTSAAYVPAEKAWIIDGNSDGKGDTIFVQFKETLPELPGQIFSIDWPKEGENNYQAGEGEISFYEREDGTPDSTIVVIVLKDNEFDFGATRTSAAQKPSLRLPPGIVFAGVEVPVEDGMGPIIVKAVKKPSDLNYYRDFDGEVRRNPDTLIVTFSEKIVQAHNGGSPWDSLIMFVSPNEEKVNAIMVLSLTAPVVLDGTDSLEWMFILSNEDDVYKPLLDDIIFLNPDAPYTDLSPGKNTPQDREALVEGTESSGNINNSFIFVPVEGVSVGNPGGLIPNITYADNGKVVFGNNTRTITNADGKVETVQEWIRPRGLNRDGKIDEGSRQCKNESEETGEISVYPANCLSAVKVVSRDRYVAQIAIFDHLGKFVHSSVQRFGYCGETDNPLRRTPEGLVSWLVWNQKDLEGEFVGSGVYIWKVRFVSPDGVNTGVYRQGIARSVNPVSGCAE
ncbi:MAG: chitobiase/beta-hexosaminidase C-terminal domain-containing protein [Fibrobacteria bacterium]|nr:chitobiase/beta-hexosaminidase C-terminal domain-containing protein [Fibrobacteria bacterium]